MALRFSSMFKSIFVFLALSASMVMSGLLALADDYPSRPIRLIIPFPPGGSNDVVGRIVANQLGQKLGQTVFVDNRAGAGGVVGTDVAAKSAADGYTLLVISIAHAVDPFIYKEPFDPIKDFVPVAILATGTNVLTVNPTVPVHSVKELIDLAEAKPAFLNYASAGIGSFQNLSGELFKVMAGVDIVHLPYKGGGPSMLAVIAGEAQVMFSSIVQTVPNIQAGRLRPLATGGANAAPFCPSSRPSPKPAYLVMWRPTGGEFSRPPARRSQSLTSCMARSKRCCARKTPRKISSN